MDMIEEEIELIREVRYNNSSEALKKLFNKYLPMIDNIVNHYYIRSFDRDDWHQEAYIVCHETCFKYTDELGSKFGNFYKMRFNNHVKSLLRKELAIKRRIDKEAASFEQDIIADSFSGQFVGGNKVSKTIDVNIDFDSYLESLTEIEVEAFKMLLGSVSFETACKNQKCTPQQMKNAMMRCKKKLLEFVNQG